MIIDAINIRYVAKWNHFAELASHAFGIPINFDNLKHTDRNTAWKVANGDDDNGSNNDADGAVNDVYVGAALRLWSWRGR